MGWSGALPSALWPPTSGNQFGTPAPGMIQIDNTWYVMPFLSIGGYINNTPTTENIEMALPADIALGQVLFVPPFSVCYTV